MMKTRPPGQWPFSSVVLMENKWEPSKKEVYGTKEYGQEALNFSSRSTGEIRTMMSVSSLISWTNFCRLF